MQELDRRLVFFDSRLATDVRVAQDYGLNKDTVGKIRREMGYYKHPHPKVNHTTPPENVMAFLEGMVSSPRFGVDIIHWGSLDYPYIRVETYSSQLRLKNLLAVTMKGRGDKAKNKDIERYYLDYEVYKGFLDPFGNQLTHNLKAKIRFAPFSLAVLVVNLSQAQNRLSLNNRYVQNIDKTNRALNRIHTKFERYFGFRLGRSGHREDTGSDYVIVKHPEEVYRVLLEQQSVLELPFRKYLPFLDEAQLPQLEDYPLMHDPDVNVFLEEDLPELETKYRDLRNLRKEVLINGN